MFTNIRLIGAASALVLGLSGIATAQEAVRVTAVSGYPVTAAWVRLFEEVYAPAVDAALAEDGEYRIEWNFGWGGAIVAPRGELEALEAGLADIGIVQTIFHPDKLNIYNVAYATPFTTTDIDFLTQTINTLAEEFPAMKEVWAKNNQVMLTSLAGVDNYQILLRQPVEGIEGLEGRKFSGAGLNLLYLEGVKGVGVTVPLSDVYNSLSTGLIDGSIIWPEAMFNFKLYEAAPYMLDVDFGGVNSMALSVNADAWDRFPDPVRDALNANADLYRTALAEFAMQTSDSSVEKMKAEGLTVIELSDENRAKWAAQMPNVAKIWSESVDAEGQPGTEVLAAYLSAMSAQSYVPLRDWTK